MSPGAEAARRDEVLVEIAQRIVGGHHHLLAAYEGGKRREQAQREITSSCHYSGGAGYFVKVAGKNVEFCWSGIEGKARIVDLLKIAADAGTPAKVNRLRFHARAWVVAHQGFDQFVGPGGVTQEKRKSARYVELTETAERAYREMLDARDAWWDVENATEGDLWQAGIDALRYAVTPADVPAALAFYAFVLTDEHRALAALRRAELRAAEGAAA